MIAKYYSAFGTSQQVTGKLNLCPDGNILYISRGSICGFALISSIIFSDVFCRVPELVTSVPEPVPELIAVVSELLSELFMIFSEPNTSSELLLPLYMNAISAKKTIWLSVISKDISNTHYI